MKWIYFTFAMMFGLMLSAQDMITNSGFNSPIDGTDWTVLTSTVATTEIDPSGQLYGPNSAKITSTTDNQTYQLAQYVTDGTNAGIVKDHSYRVQYTAKASADIYLQETIVDDSDGSVLDQHYGYNGTGLNLTTDPQYINDPFTAQKDATCNWVFQFTTQNGVIIWIDSVRLIDEGILPVAWSRPITAKIVNGSAQITWSVAHQTDNEKFVVEYSRDGKRFQAIGEIKGEKDLQEEKTYTFIHSHPAAGSNYYRIKQLDYDGSINYSNITTARFKPVMISGYPNPVVDNYHLHVGQDITLSIYNAEGKCMDAFPAKRGEIDIDMNRYPHGIYFIKTKNEILDKIIKE